MKYQELLNCIKRIRDAINNNPKLDQYSKGYLGNLLGELKSLEYGATVEVKQQSSKVQKIILLWENDPVIKAYLSQKEELEGQIAELKLYRNDDWDD